MALGFGFRKRQGLEDILGVQINPATEDKQDDIISNLGTPGIIDDGSKNVTNAGTAVALSSSSVPCKRVDIVAKLGNTGLIAVGGANVVASAVGQRGVLLEAGDFYSLAIDNLNKVFIDSTQNGDGVTFTFYA